jgi:hypothetical protein
MKRYLIPILALSAVLCSCDKSDDFYGSGEEVSYATAGYMMCIADDLVVDNLKEMERILALDKSGAVWEPGYSSVFERSNQVFGATLSKSSADSTWTIVFDGDFNFESNSYPTRYHLTLRMLPGEGTGASQAGGDGGFDGEGSAQDAPFAGMYHDWEVSIEEGVRTERGGYSAEFRSYPTLKYHTSGATLAWHLCYGAVWMDVRKDGKIVDSLVLVLKGQKSNYETRRLS